jgi:hypothetical protein
MQYDSIKLVRECDFFSMFVICIQNIDMLNNFPIMFPREKEMMFYNFQLLNHHDNLVHV